MYGFLRVLPCLEFTNSILPAPRIFLRHCTPLAPATPPFPLCYLFVCCSFSMSVEFNNQYGTRIGHKSESSEAPSCGFNSGRGSPRPGSGVSLGSCARRPRLPCPLRRVLLRWPGYGAAAQAVTLPRSPQWLPVVRLKFQHSILAFLV